MSVINQMLKDLEARERAESVSASVPLAQPARSLMRLIAVLLIGAALGVGGYLFLQARMLPQPVAVTAVEPEPQAPLVQVNPEPIKPPTKVRTTQAESTSTQPAASEARILPEPVAAQIEETPAPVQEPSGESRLAARSSVAVVQAPVAAPDSQMKVARVESDPVVLAARRAEQAKAALHNNQAAQAVALYKEAVALTPADVALRKQLANLYLQLNQTDQAMHLLDNGVAAVPDSTELRVDAARLWAARNELGRAYAYVSQPLASVQSAQEYYTMRAGLAHKLGQYDVAIDSYAKLAQFDAANGRWWLGLALAHDAKQEFGKALAAFKAALQSGTLSPSSEFYARQRASEIEGVQ